MGGAQPLAVTMNGGVALVVEVDGARIERRLATKYVDERCEDLDTALARATDAMSAGIPRSIALEGKAARILLGIVERGIRPDVVTDQTSAHDPLTGYVPDAVPFREAIALRQRAPDTYIQMSMAAMGGHDARALYMKRP